MRPTLRRRFPGGRKAVVYAVLVHVLLIALVVVGFRSQSKPVSPAAVIQAQAVNDAEMQKEIQQRQRDEAERAAAEAKRLRDQQAVERQAAEAQRQKEQAKLAEQKRKVDVARQAAQAEAKRKADAKRQAAEAEQQRKVAQRQAEAQRKKDAEARRQAAVQGLKEQLASEEQERADAKARAEQQARAQSELERFQALIKQRVESSWVNTGGWTKDIRCLVHVRLIPTGEVIEATVVRSSGNAAFDRSAENAVYKASPLPLPEDKALFEHFRDFNFDFHPQERS